jgi:hypothetical protein
MIMPTLQVETEQLLQAALQMPRAELEQFVARLLALKISQDTPHLSKAESELLLTINEGIPSATQQRLDALIAKRQAHTLTRGEHQELLQITEQIEQRDAERLQHLIELAALRHVTLDALMQQLGLQPAPHA